MAWFAQKLIKLLANYPPAKMLGYSEDELESLRAFRGRASHADSKGGAKELAEVKAEVMKKMTRLKTLLERVIVTKKTWGIPTLELEELAPVTAFVRHDGVIVIYKPTAAPSSQ